MSPLKRLFFENMRMLAGLSQERIAHGESAEASDFLWLVKKNGGSVSDETH